MADTGFVLVSSGVNFDDGATLDWDTAGNVTASDDQYAANSGFPKSGDITQLLQALNPHNGSAFDEIGPGDTIVGVEILIERNGSSFTDHTIRLIKGGALSGNNEADLVTEWPSADGFALYGGPANLMGVALTPADVKAANFGVGIKAIATSDFGSVNVDAVWIKIYFTAAAGEPTDITRRSFVSHFTSEGTPGGSLAQGDFLVEDADDVLVAVVTNQETFQTGQGPSLPSASYNNVQMSREAINQQLIASNANGDTYVTEAVFVLVNPATGVNQFSHAIGELTGTFASAIVTSYKNVDKIDPVGTSVNDGSTTPEADNTIPLTSASDNSMLFGGNAIVSSEVTAVTPAAGVTELFESPGVSLVPYGSEPVRLTYWAGERPTTTAGVYTVGGTISADEMWAGAWIELKQAAPTAPPSQQTLPFYSQAASGSAQTVFSATGLQSLANYQQSANAEVLTPVSADGAQELANLEQTAQAEMPASGLGAQALAGFEQQGTAEQVFTVTGDQALDAIAQSGVVALLPVGVGAQLLSQLEQSADVISGFNAEGAQDLQQLLQEGEGAAPIVLTGQQTLPDVLQQANGEQPLAGLGDQGLSQLVQLGESVVVPSVVGEQDLADTIQRAQSLEIFVLSGQQELPLIEQVAAASMEPSGSADQSLPETQQQGTAEQPYEAQGDQTLQNAEQNATAFFGDQIFATGQQVLALLEQTADAIILPVGGGEQLLSGLAQSAAGVELHLTQAVQELQPVLQTSVATLVPEIIGAQTLGAYRQVGTGIELPVGIGFQILPAFTQIANVEVVTAFIAGNTRVWAVQARNVVLGVEPRGTTLDVPSRSTKLDVQSRGTELTPAPRGTSWDVEERK